jgi:hypothetical protein
MDRHNQQCVRLFFRNAIRIPNLDWLLLQVIQQELQRKSRNEAQGDQKGETKVHQLPQLRGKNVLIRHFLNSLIVSGNVSPGMKSSTTVFTENSSTFYNRSLQTPIQCTSIRYLTILKNRDVSLIITTILNVMPIASQKFCRKFGIKLILHQDQDNKATFDTLTEQLRMFDSDDIKNWRLLGFAVTQLCSDLILFFLENPIRKIEISKGLIDILLEICKYYSTIQSFM